MNDSKLVYSAPLSFTLGKNNKMQRKRLTLILVVTVIATALWASTMLIAYTDREYICENTGSRQGYRDWFFGAKTGEWYHDSELERFMEASHPDILEHRWTSYRGTGSSLIPFMTSRGHGRPGPIMTPSIKMLDTHVNSLAIDERLELYYIFSGGDVAKIENKVNVIFKN